MPTNQLSVNSTKFFTITGEVVRRIFNPEFTTESGRKMSKNYLVVKWISGQNGEYQDYVPVIVWEGKRISHIRAGYKIKLNVVMSCKLYKESVEYDWDINTGSTRPKLYPNFTLSKGEIEIIDSSTNYERHEDVNNKFNNDVINNLEGEDDLPF